MNFERMGDQLEVTIRDDNFRKIYHREVGIHNKKELEKVLIELKHKGIDFIKIVRTKMISDSDWFS